MSRDCRNAALARLLWAKLNEEGYPCPSPPGDGLSIEAVDTLLVAADRDAAAIALRKGEWPLVDGRAGVEGENPRGPGERVTGVDGEPRV